jgi:2-iminobutanoate/2-iminopropanoate deaminase
MSFSILQTDRAPAPVGPYSQGIVAQGDLIFVSGQIPLDPATGAIVSPEDVVGQTRQVMANLQAVLEAAGIGFEQVVKTTVFLSNLEDFAQMNGVYGEYFDNDRAPARACVEVARLPKDVKVEIDCIAVRA